MMVLIKMLAMPVLIILLILIITGLFIGAGFLISLILPLTIFQASVLLMGTTFMLGFIFSVMMIGEPLVKISNPRTYRYEEDEEDEDDYDDEDDDEYDERLRNVSRLRSQFTVVNTQKTGRNEPCPCGSGKKYKHCCGK